MRAGRAAGPRARGRVRRSRDGPGEARRRDAVRVLRDARAGVVRSGRGHRLHHAVLPDVGDARRAGEDDARQGDGPEPGRVVDRQRRPEDLRLQAPRGREVPQRRSVHRRGREVQLRARQGLPDPEGEDARGRGREPVAREDPPERALAGLHGVLRHDGGGARLDRAEEVHREGRRRRLQEGAGRSRPVQVRQPQSRHRARARGERELLAEDAVGEASRLQEHPGVEHAHGDAQARRGRRRLPARGPAGPGDQARPHPQARVLGRHRDVLSRLLRHVGREVAVARQARAARGQPRARPQGPERGGDARPVAADRELRPARRSSSRA